MVAGANHHWNAMWNSSIYGGFGHIDYSTAAGVALNGGAAGYDADWAFWQVGSRTAVDAGQEPRRSAST